MPSTPYTWLPLTTAIQQIQDRLNDQNSRWSTAELQVYLIEALRILNALTESWRAEFTFNIQGATWNNTGTMAGSPRLRTVTDANLATQMEYMLLEPPVGIGSWTGTSQFSVEKIQSSLSVRRNEIIQVAGCNTANLSPINASPGARRTALADTSLEIRRIRFLQLQASPNGTASSGSQALAVSDMTGLYVGLLIQGANIASGTVVSSLGSGSVGISLPTTGAVSGQVNLFQPFYLKRSDTQAFHYFDSDYLQQLQTPKEWSIASEPPLSFDVDTAPSQPGEYDVLVLQSGPSFSTTPSLLGMPDDWSWLPMYGALADLLSEQPESTDKSRAAYCAKRYQDGLDMMRKSNWFLQALVNGAVADTPSLEKKDRWTIGWQEDSDGIPCVVTDGIDAFAVAPGAPCSVLMTLVQNAPFLDSTLQYVQVTRDDWDQVLNYVQHVAMFNCGGKEFSDSVSLLDEFFSYCQRKNKRQATYGLYVDVLNTAGQKQDLEQPR